MASLPKSERFNRRGTITLYFNGKEIIAQQFQSPRHRKEVVEHWDRKYQFDKKDTETIYLHISYD